MKILIASSIHDDAISKLSEEHDVICAFNAPKEKLIKLIVDRQVLIFRSGVQITKEVMEAAPSLHYLIRAGSGLDNLDVNYVEQNSIELIRIPEPGAKAVAELSFSFMLILSREILKADKFLRQGKWLKSDLNGYLLTGKVLGIIGAGNIGSLVGKMGAAWEMKVLGCIDSSDYSPEYEAELNRKGIELSSFNEVVSKADYLSIHVPLSDKTRNLVDESVIAKMKNSAYLINLARGGVVDEQALLNALKNGKLRGAALDVHIAEGENKISPLAELPNVVLTPHIGAQTIDSQREIGELVIEHINRFVAKIENFSNSEIKEQ